MLGSAYQKLKKTVDEHILDFLPEIDSKSGTLYDAMRYSLIAGGKRIRPVLLLASYELAARENAQMRVALPFACAAEYLHTYSLIHDDLPAMDDDDYRRGQLSNHKVYGEAIAILAGDGLLSSAFEAVTKDMLLYLDDAAALACRTRALFALTKGCGVRGMIAGQVADIEAENAQCSTEMLDFIHLNKTAALIRGCVTAGMYLAGAGKQMIEDGQVYGEALGLAFQIIDDIQDVVGDPKELGKSVGVDAKLNKSTYPAIYGLDQSRAKAREQIEKARGAIAKYYDEAEVLADILNYMEEQIR